MTFFGVSRFHNPTRTSVGIAAAFFVLGGLMPCVKRLPQAIAGDRAAVTLLGVAEGPAGETAVERSIGGDDSELESGVTAAITPGPYVLASNFLCDFAHPNCRPNSIVRYVATPGTNLGKHDGFHITNIEGPYTMAVHPVRRTLIVASRPTHTIKEYNLQTGAFLGNFVVGGDEGLHLPQYIAFMPTTGDLLVSSFQSEFNFEKINGVLQFDGTTGQFVRVFHDGGFILFEECIRPPSLPNAPCLRGAGGMAFGGPNGNLFVGSQLNNSILELNGSTGALVAYYDSDRLLYPQHLIVRPNISGMQRINNIDVTSQYHATETDFDKIVEFSQTTKEVVAIPPINNLHLINGLQTPGPLIFAMFETTPSLLVSAQVFTPSYTYSAIRTFNANTGGFTANFNRTTEPFLNLCTGLLLVNINCQSNSDCNDGNPCTDDLCSSGQCTNTVNNVIDPDDGLACNGVEDRCVNGTVKYQFPPPNCVDNLPCTLDMCNEELDACENPLREGHCLIGGVCYILGELDVSTGCRECNPLANPTAWTPSLEGTGCGDQNNMFCDRPNTCNGAGLCLSNVDPNGTPCGDDTVTECSGADTCLNGTCRTNDLANNTTCNDRNPCTLTDRCNTGACIGTGTPCTNPLQPICIINGTNAQCVQCDSDNDCFDDPNRCTSVRCLTDLHQCFEFANDANCLDNLFCDGVRRCNVTSGQCDSGPPPCTQGQICDETNDRCIGCLLDSDCADSLYCNGVERCVNNVCQPGTPPDCTSLNGACVTGACNETLDRCVTQPGNEGGPCNDGNGCTTTDRCVSGVCNGSGAPNCDDGNSCTTDSCSNGQCIHVNNSGACDDLNPCTSGETCSAGNCTGGVQMNCNDNNPCTVDSCHAVLGCRYVNVPASPPTACSDGSACTINDFCFGGFCVGEVVNCDDANPCTTDTCDAVLGCRRMNNTNPCDDNNACTTGDACVNGTCAGGPQINCNDGNPCTSDSCSFGICNHLNNTNPCNDNNLCTENDRCGNGGCSGTPRTCPGGTSCNPSSGVCKDCLNDSECNDNNPCTNDSCVSGDCQHVPNSLSCDDGFRCTINDVCSNRVCSGTPVSCPSGRRCDPANGMCVQCFDSSECGDGNVCTADSCNNGTCAHTPTAGSCNDGSLCTLNDACSGGTCRGTNVACNVPEVCDPTDGICKECLTNNECADGDACSVDRCVNGTCEHVVDANRCRDSDPCTTDFCNPQTGACLHTLECVYGDVAPPSDSDCAVDVSDVNCALDGFRRTSRCSRADVFPCGGNGIINIEDVLAVIEAFKGNPSCEAPESCP